LPAQEQRRNSTELHKRHTQVQRGTTTKLHRLHTKEQRQNVPNLAVYRSATREHQNP
jgi:hypothetical protein